MSASNEPFIAKQDRPAVKLPNPDQPISELRVRDLQAILSGPIFKVRKDTFKEFAKDIKEWAYEKPPYIEYLVAKAAIETGPDPTINGDPGILAGMDQVIQAVGGLSQKVSDLSDQVAKLQKKG
jgi:hypothetical protein